MILYKTDAEIELMKKSARLVSETLTEVAKMLKPGVTTFQIDRLCAEFIRDHKAIPSFLNYRGYPFNSCISVNDVVVHGFPNNDALKEGDIVSIDIGVILNEWHGDHAYTFAIGDPGEEPPVALDTSDTRARLFGDTAQRSLARVSRHRRSVRR